MSSRYFRAARAAHAGTALAGLLSLAGCSMFHGHGHDAASTTAPAPAPAAIAADSSAATAPVPQTVTDALGAPSDASVADAVGAAGASAASDASVTSGAAGDTTTVVDDVGPQLKSTAPKSYVVRHGDTLWGIANLFLRDPWTWPEIWYVNPQIQNPHRIYPGDQLRLALGSNGRTTLQLVRAQLPAPGASGLPGSTRLRPLLRSSALDTPIEAIPHSILAAFLSHPSVLTMDQIRSAGYIVSLPQNHDIAGLDNEVFIKQLSGEIGARYSVLHMDQPLIDPDNGHRVGYLGIYTGTAEITRPGRVSEAVLTDSARETLPGDVLIPEEHESVGDFVPHMPDRPVSARIMAAVDNVGVVGQDQVVAINRGSADGLERGNVLTVDQEVQLVPDPCANIDNASTCVTHPILAMPTDVAGTLLVFRTYEHMSYALILNDTVPVQLGDRAHSP